MCKCEPQNAVQESFLLTYNNCLKTLAERLMTIPANPKQEGVLTTARMVMKSILTFGCT